jgi:hypothetical protein
MTFGIQYVTLAYNGGDFIDKITTVLLDFELLITVTGVQTLIYCIRIWDKI